MLSKVCVRCMNIILVLICVCPAMAQMEPICEFENIKVPFTLKDEESSFEKGKYDFELLKMNNIFYLRIKKEGKPVCLKPHGQKVAYKNLSDPEIPQRSKFRIKRNPALKIAYIIFESGSHHKEYPFLKVRFRMNYEE
ncbi:MAG: hypothetical protein PVI66_09555 [Candidatus Aminicenantes bacterium]